MKIASGISFIIFFLLGVVCAQGQVTMQRDDISLPADFTNALNRSQMLFEMPEGFTVTKTIPNGDMDYIYALTSRDKKMEVRYVVWPLDSQIARYNRPREEGETRIDPNTIYKTISFMHMANISSTPFDQLQEIASFDSTAVMNEFGADWGGTAAFELRKSFGQKYKWCSVIALHKDKVADAWLFFLAKNKDDLQAGMMPAFHSLKFK